MCGFYTIVEDASHGWVCHVGKDGFKIMIVSYDVLVVMKTWKKNIMLTWRNDWRYFYNEFEYAVKK